HETLFGAASNRMKCRRALHKCNNSTVPWLLSLPKQLHAVKLGYVLEAGFNQFRSFWYSLGCLAVVIVRIFPVYQMGVDQSTLDVSVTQHFLGEEEVFRSMVC